MSGPFNTETVITLSKTELLSLLFKLDRADSAKALIRRGENLKDYYIKAISDDEAGGRFRQIHPIEDSRIDQFFLWERGNKK